MHSVALELKVEEYYCDHYEGMLLLSFHTITITINQIFCFAVSSNTATQPAMCLTVTSLLNVKSGWSYSKLL